MVGYELALPTTIKRRATLLLGTPLYPHAAELGEPMGASLQKCAAQPTMVYNGTGNEAPSSGKGATTMPEASPITEYRLTDHAQLEKERRQITEAEIAQVLSAPEQSEIVRPGRMVYQSRVEFGEPVRTYLLRVFVDVDRQPAEVVTTYGL